MELKKKQVGIRIICFSGLSQVHMVPQLVFCIKTGVRKVIEMKAKDCFIFSAIMIYSMITVTGFVYVGFPNNYVYHDPNTNLVVYASEFVGAAPLLTKISTSVNLAHTQEGPIPWINKTIKCEARRSTVTSSGNKTNTVTIPVPTELQNKAKIAIAWSFKPGKYNVVFRSDEDNQTFGETYFELQVKHSFVPPRYIDIEGTPKHNITAGRATYIHSDVSIDCLSLRSWNITIGSFTSIAKIEFFLARSKWHRADFITTYPLHSILNEIEEEDETINGLSHSVVIGNDVWIGANTVIINNLTIGHGAIIGAYSVLRESVPPYAVVYGNPAVVVKYRFPPHIIAKLLEMQWWNWEEKRIISMAQFNSVEEVIVAWEQGMI